jgi:hypothetical protein
MAATNYTITVTDSLNQSASQTFSLTVNALSILTAIQTQANYDLYRSTSVTTFTPIRANGGFGTISYSISPTLPSGLLYSNSTGIVSGTPTTTSTTSTYSVTLTDQGSQSATGTFALNVSSIPISVTQQIASTILYRNVAFNTFIPVTASGGYTPYTYSITPSLSSGLSFSTSSGYISGTATTSSAAISYTVAVIDSVSQQGTSSFSITVLNPSAITLVKSVSNLTITQGVAVTAFTPVSASGGYGTISYAISPTLPTGLIFDTTTGRISGTPSTYSINATAFTVTVSDQAGQTSTDSFNLTVLTPT